MNIRNAYYTPGGFNDLGIEETPHLTGKVYFEIRCAVCHAGLCKEMTIAKSPRRNQNLVFVQPCPRCIGAARIGIPVAVIPLSTLDDDYRELEG